MNLKELLKCAMELEKTQAEIYKGLMKKFSFSEEISELWASMAEDEKGHYELIAEIYKKLDSELLLLEADKDLCDKVSNGLNVLNLERLNDVLDLNDACNLAHEVENYETDAVFKFAQTKFKHGLNRLELASMIFAHLDKLCSFSERFGSAEEKKKIKVNR